MNTSIMKYNSIRIEVISMRKVIVAAIQMKMDSSSKMNISKASDMVKKAAGMGANIVLLPELFENTYFCQERKYESYQLATSVTENAAVKAMSQIAGELHVVIPVSFFERDGNSLFNSVAMIDTDGMVMGVYRKTHIPDDHFYQEKFYFTPGNTGFKVWDTEFGKIGVGICWDQWFPEAARCMALEGAELLLYPTAIGSEPILETDSMPHWRRCMQGHSAANIMPVIAANRIGTEEIVPCEENANQSSSIKFYGSSFITDETGGIVQSASRDKEEVILHEFDLEEIEQNRLSWGVFRDRRPDCYFTITEK